LLHPSFAHCFRSLRCLRTRSNFIIKYIICQSWKKVQWMNWAQWMNEYTFRLKIIHNKMITYGIIRHCLWNIIQDFWICLFYWTRPVYKQGYKFFSRWAKRNREKLIALFVNRSSFLIKNKQIQNSVMWFLKQWCIIFYTMFCQILHK
jgi:hypothetical protein